MGTCFRRVSLLVLFIALCHAAFGQAQDTSPIQIAFDQKSERIDLKTGEQLPDYTRAKRGSLLFYRDWLEEGVNVITFYHDGMREVDPGRLAFMEKVQEQFAIWRLQYRGANKNTPRIHDKAVSFIPLDSDGRELDRVFVRLDDLQRIEWSAE